jgi:hypothetical protein
LSFSSFFISASSVVLSFSPQDHLLLLQLFELILGLGGFFLLDHLFLAVAGRLLDDRDSGVVDRSSRFGVGKGQHQKHGQRQNAQQLQFGRVSGFDFGHHGQPPFDLGLFEVVGELKQLGAHVLFEQQQLVPGRAEALRNDSAIGQILVSFL